MRMSPREIRKSYAGLIDMAKSFLKVGDVEKALETIDKCVILAQQFNWIYADEELESLERQIGSMLLPNASYDYQNDSNNIVFFDDFCIPYVLAIQYLRALVNMGKKVRFVTSRINFNNDTSRFFDSIKLVGEVEIVKIPKLSLVQTVREIYRVISEFHPAKVILHIYANSKVVPALYALPRQITKYLINLADQTFWLGAGAIDYCIEFRSFGASVSLQRRGLKREQLLMLPFYPIKIDVPFKGFPAETDGHIVIYSGGDVYKVMDSDGLYWKLVKQLLNSYPEIVFLFGTKVNNHIGSSIINSFIRNNHFEGRFIPIGFRSDINEVIKHCDIYFGTFPASGSLMTQLAAMNAKPILQYYYPGTPDDETEQSLCVNEELTISFRDVDAFMLEANRLITDPVYRKYQGERLERTMIQIDQFESALAKTIETNETQFPITIKDIDYKSLDDRWYELEKCGFVNTMSYVCSVFGKHYCMKYVPSVFLKKQLDILRNRFVFRRFQKG